MYPEDAAADEDCSIVVGNGTSVFTAARKYSTSVSEYSSSEDAVAGSAAAEEEISCDRYVQFRLGKFDSIRCDSIHFGLIRSIQLD